MKGRLYAVGIIGIVLIAIGVLIESEFHEAFQWMGTGMLASFAFLYMSHFRNPEQE